MKRLAPQLKEKDGCGLLFSLLRALPLGRAFATIAASMEQTFLSHSAEETHAAGRELGARLQRGDLVTLTGELGAGKTTFAQGVAAALGIDDAPSPTYVLIIEHEGRLPLLHLDAYRLEGACFDVVRDAGVDEFFTRRDAVKLVEWPSFVADWMPRPRFTVHIQHISETERAIQITGD
jgi:tRNA threonylcarbamoyladenosine biosynthesis protein TsaE